MKNIADEILDRLFEKGSNKLGYKIYYRNKDIIDGIYIELYSECLLIDIKKNKIILWYFPDNGEENYIIAELEMDIDEFFEFYDNI